MDLDALVAKAAVILDEASKPFIAGHRADSAVQKKGNDFATEVDLAIERQVVEALESATGIGVHGEEFGGADLDAPLVWVLDPIDGTFNYAAGSPMAAILLGLLRDGEPTLRITQNDVRAIQLAKAMGPGKTIVTILCDSGMRYQSRLFNPAFLRSKNLPVPEWLERATPPLPAGVMHD